MDPMAYVCENELFSQNFLTSGVTNFKEHTPLIITCGYQLIP